MAAINDLQSSGLLHRDNYQQWLVKMEAVLRAHGVARISATRPQRRVISNDVFANFGFANITRQQLASVLSRRRVSPELLKAVPKGLYEPQALIDHLYWLTFQFRFLDLPAEDAQSCTFITYNMVPKAAEDPTDAGDPEEDSDSSDGPDSDSDNNHNDEGCEDIVDGSANKCSMEVMEKKPGYPALSQVFQQIRREFLPVFYTRTTFHFDFDDDDESWCCSNCRATTFNDKIVPGFQAWAALVERAQLRNITTVVLTLVLRTIDDDYQPAEFVFRITEPEGLRVAPDIDLKPFAKCRIETHVSNVEITRKLLGLRGEAIIMAVISNHILWEDGSLLAKPWYRE